MDRLGKTITAIVNISLQEGIFADKWKVAIVRPLLKKAGLDLVAANYRPVSNLPFLSKVNEKCMLKHFNRHCEMNNFLPEYQSAYRQHYSCETALVKMADDILWSMEHQRITAVVAIDLIAAFDTVDHDILLKVLGHKIRNKRNSEQVGRVILATKECQSESWISLFHHTPYRILRPTRVWGRAQGSILHIRAQ